jgi:hypothetical protein
VSAALSAGATALVLLASAPPDALEAAAVAAAAAAFPSARVSLAVIDGRVAGCAPLLLHALYAARPPGVGVFAGVLLPPLLPASRAAAVAAASLGTPPASGNELAWRVAAALGAGAAATALPGAGRGTLDPRACYVLPIPAGEVEAADAVSPRTVPATSSCCYVCNSAASAQHCIGQQWTALPASTLLT